jgi:hypothetical protein
MGNVLGKDYTATHLQLTEIDDITVQPKTFNVQSCEAEGYFSSHANT